MQVSRILISALILFSTASFADYDDAELEQLFTSKSQRAQIDAARSGSNSGLEPEYANKVQVSGYLKRSNGKNVVWVNGGNTLNASKVGNVKVYPGAIDVNNKKVPVSIDGQRVYLRPGESWSKTTGRIKEDY